MNVTQILNQANPNLKVNEVTEENKSLFIIIEAYREITADKPDAIPIDDEMTIEQLNDALKSFTGFEGAEFLSLIDKAVGDDNHAPVIDNGVRTSSSNVDTMKVVLILVGGIFLILIVIVIWSMITNRLDPNDAITQILSTIKDVIVESFTNPPTAGN